MNFLKKQDRGWTCQKITHFVHKTLFNYHLLSTDKDALQAALNSEYRIKKTLDLYLKELDPNQFYRSNLNTDQLLGELKQTFNSSQPQSQCQFFESLYFKIVSNKKQLAPLVSKSLSHQNNLHQTLSKIHTDLKNKNNSQKKSYEKNFITSPLKKIIFTSYHYYASAKNIGESDQSAFKVALRRIRFATGLKKIHSKNIIGQSLMKAYLNSLDYHSKYYNEDEYTLSVEKIRLSFFGIGATLMSVGDGLRVRTIIKNGPSDHRGKNYLKKDDLIISINGKTERALLPLQEAIKFLKGPKNTTVDIVVQRGQQKISLNVKRGPVNNSGKGIQTETKAQNNLSANQGFIKVSQPTALPPQFGYLKFDYFFSSSRARNGVAHFFKEELQKLNDNNVKGLLLDLRGNRGGSLTEVLKILGYFLGKQTFVQTKNHNGKIEKLSSSENQIFDKPLVVLINEKSASAAEILSGNLQAFNRAIIVGTKQSFGKGIVQLSRHMSSWFKKPYNVGGMKITGKGYYLASGHSPQYSGILSDIVVHSPRQGARKESDLNPLVKGLSPVSDLFASGETTLFMSDTKMQQLINKVKRNQLIKRTNDPVKNYGYQVLELMTQ